MVRLVELMLEQSDNFLAEALARQVALVQGKPASFAGSGEAMKEVLQPSSASPPRAPSSGRRQRAVA